MFLKMYTLYDSKTESYIPPFYAKAKGDAIRQISAVVNNPDSKQEFGKYPEDFTLFEIATFDDATGMVIPNSVHENLGCLINFKSSEVN